MRALALGYLLIAPLITSSPIPTGTLYASSIHGSRKIGFAPASFNPLMIDL